MDVPATVAADQSLGFQSLQELLCASELGTGRRRIQVLSHFTCGERLTLPEDFQDLKFSARDPNRTPGHLIVSSIASIDTLSTYHRRNVYDVKSPEEAQPA
jgi:hypothetical protein